MAIHDEEGLQKAEIEARLLSGATFDQIAAKMDLPVSVIQLYHDVIYDVCTRLKASGFIQFFVLRPAPEQRGPIDEARIWREVGWQCPAALELLIADSRHQTSPADHAMAERIRLQIRLNNMSMLDPDYRRLIRQLRNDTVTRAITAPSAALAQILAYLDQMELPLRKAMPRRNPRSKVQSILDKLNLFRKPQGRRCKAPVTQETDHGLGDPGRTALPISVVSGSDDGQGAPPLSGPGICGGSAGDQAEGAPGGQSLPSGANCSRTTA
jgi:hypothetical protein